MPVVSEATPQEEHAINPHPGVCNAIQFFKTWIQFRGRNAGPKGREDLAKAEGMVMQRGSSRSPKGAKRVLWFNQKNWMALP
jgi:hypothetical protein